MKRTLIQCLHRTCSSTHTRKKHKKRPRSSSRNRCPATFEGIYTSVQLIVFKTAGVLSSKCHHRHVSFPSRNCTSPFSGVVLLSLFIAGLQNSRLILVECSFSTIPTFVNLPGGCISSAFTFRYNGVLQIHLLFCCLFLYYLTVLGNSLKTDFLFCDLLLGSVFPRIITIICINNKLN